MKYPNIPILPKKIFVAKRLAQCLNPVLPSGVHLKTLELFEIIFEKMVPDAPVSSFLW